jgi:hypothetical protein
VVPPVQASSRRRRLLVSFATVTRKKGRRPRNFYPLSGFVGEGTRNIARRRLCDAKTQLTIPGAQPSSSNIGCFRGPVISWTVLDANLA